MKARLILFFSVLICYASTFTAQSSPVDTSFGIEINFELDSDRLSAKARGKLDSVLELAPIPLLKKVEIYGHTDSLAGVDYNRQLSKRRVQSLLAYLVYQGLDPLKVKADYYGEERPKYDNGPRDRYRNRRCELLFIIDPGLMPQPELKLSEQVFKPGDKVRISNLQFVGNQPIPMPESFASLRELLLLMQRNPDMAIEIQGHVCCSHDQRLSEERAWMVYHYLEGNGIEGRRMSAKGYSNSQPLFKERSEREKALNRRVEILIVENSGRREEVPGQEVEIDLRAPIMSLQFMQNSGRLTPAGDFALELIAESMKGAENLKYDFVIYDNIDNANLTKTRLRNVERTLLRKKADRQVFSVSDEPAPRRMPKTDDNLVVVRISER